MRVLFALACSEQQEEKIIQCYREKYGENLDVTSVYFFKSLIDTVRKSAPFDRIIIHENLEATGRKNKDVFDEYIFKNIDALTDEAGNATIIFLCNDNRRRDDRLLNKMFNMGVYNILIGAEGTFSRVCELIKNPMTKKDAKKFLEVNTESETYEDPNKVSEIELRNILDYYQKNINNKENIISGFDNNLYEQYTIQKLKVIISFLPAKVRDILYVYSDKYRAVLGEVVKIVEVPVYMDENNNIVSVSTNTVIDTTPTHTVTINTGGSTVKSPVKEPEDVEPKTKKGLLGFLKKEKVSNKIEEKEVPVNETQDVQEFKPVYKTEMPISDFRIDDTNKEKPNVVVEIKENTVLKEEIKADEIEIKEPKVEEPFKVEVPEEPKVEEPAKVEVPEEPKVEESAKVEVPEEPKVEEPFKVEVPEEPKVEEPFKVEVPEEPKIQTPIESVVVEVLNEEKTQDRVNNMFANGPQIQTVTQVIEREVIKEIYETPSDYKKAIAFIGAHKAGTTFIINAIAANLISKGVKTAILDLTKNKDTYSIYAANNSEYKEVAGSSIPNLAIGQDVPLKIGDLSIYTGIPRVDRTKLDAMRSIEKIRNQNAVILVDCDFTTAIDIFRMVNNIFVIQDMDIMNILPITMFLKELKVRDIDLNKVEIIINKYLKSTLTVGKIVEALSYYTNPEMTFVNELLPKTVKRFVVPFDEQNYLRYVESLYAAKLNFEGFSEEFKQAIASIVHDIFPISSTADVSQQQEIIQSNGKLLKNIFKKKK